MIILQDGELAVDADKYQWRVLRRKGVKEDGSDNYVPERYYVTFAGLVRGLLEYNVRQSEFSSIEELSNNVKKIHEEINAAFGHLSRDSQI